MIGLPSNQNLYFDIFISDQSVTQSLKTSIIQILVEYCKVYQLKYQSRMEIDFSTFRKIFNQAIDKGASKAKEERVPSDNALKIIHSKFSDDEAFKQIDQLLTCQTNKTPEGQIRYKDLLFDTEIAKIVKSLAQCEQLRVRNLFTLWIKYEFMDRGQIGMEDIEIQSAIQQCFKTQKTSLNDFITYVYQKPSIKAKIRNIAESFTLKTCLDHFNKEGKMREYFETFLELRSNGGLNEKSEMQMKSKKQYVRQYATTQSEIAEELMLMRLDLKKYPRNHEYKKNAEPLQSQEYLIQNALVIAFVHHYKREKEPEFKESLTDVINHLKRQLKKRSPSKCFQFSKLFNQLSPNKSLLSDLYSLKAKFLKIDALQLMRLSAKAREAANSIQGKDIILFLGKPGAGKTTLIQKFLGYTLQQKIENGLPTLLPTEKVKPEHESFVTSPESVACTRFLNAVKIPNQMLTEDSLDEQGKDVYLCDAPGFAEKGSIQTDISNLIGTIVGIRKCKSLRGVIVIHYLNLDARFEGIKTIGKIIAYMFPTFRQCNKSFKLYFNQFPENKKDYTPTRIKSLRQKNINKDQQDQKLQKFLDFVQSQSEKQGNFIDPFKNRKHFKQKLEEIIDRRSFTKVDEVRAIFSPQTSQKINEFCQDVKMKIQSSFQNQEYQLLAYYYETLNDLKMPQLQRIGQCFKEVTVFIDKKTTHMKTYIETVLNIIINELKINIQNYANIKKEVNKLNAIRRAFFNFMKKEEDNHFKNQQENLKIPSQNDIEILFTNYKNKILQSLQDLRSQNLEEKIQSALSYCNFFNDQRFKKVIKQKIQDHKQEIEKTIKNDAQLDKTENLNDLIIKAHKVSLLIPKFYEIQNKQNIFKSIFQPTFKKADAIIQQIEKIRQLPFITDTDIQTINKGIEYIENLQNSDFNKSFISGWKSAKQKQLEEAAKLIRTCISQIKEKTNSGQDQQIQEVDRDFYKTLQNHYQNMEKLANVKGLQKTIKIEQVLDIKNQVKEVLTKGTEKMEIFFEKLYANQITQKQMIEFKTSRIRISNCVEITKLEQSEVKVALSGTNNKFEQFFKNQYQEITKIKLYISLTNWSTMVEPIHKKAKMLSEMKCLSKVYPELDKKLKDNLELLNSIIQIPGQHLLAKFTDKQKRYLAQIKDFLTSLSSLQSYTQFFSSFIKIRSLNLQKLMKQSKQIKQRLHDSCLTEIFKSWTQQMFPLSLDQNDEEKSKIMRENLGNLKITTAALLAIHKKSKFTEYLKTELDFNVEDKIESIINDLLEPIYAKLDEKLKTVIVNHDHESLMRLSEHCKQFIPVINELQKNKSDFMLKLSIPSFDAIIKAINQAMNKQMTSYNTVINNLTSNTSPENLDFFEIDKIYNELSKRAQSNHESKYESQKNLEHLLSCLTKVESALITTIDKEIKSFNQDNYKSFLYNLEIAVKIHHQLNKIYKLPTEKEKIKINSSYLQKGSTALSKIFQEKYDETLEFIEKYQFKQAKNKIKEFTNIENLIIDIKMSDNEIFTGIFNKMWKKLKEKKIQPSANQLVGNALSRYNKIQEGKINGKYKSSFKFDDELKQYYHSLKTSNQSSQLADLQKNIKDTINQLINKLIAAGENFQHSKTQVITKQLIRYISLIPIDLCDQYERKMEQALQKNSRKQKQYLAGFDSDLNNGTKDFISLLEDLKKKEQKENLKQLDQKFLKTLLDSLKRFLSNKVNKFIPGKSFSQIKNEFQDSKIIEAISPSKKISQIYKERYLSILKQISEYVETAQRKLRKTISNKMNADAQDIKLIEELALIHQNILKYIYDEGIWKQFNQTKIKISRQIQQFVSYVCETYDKSFENQIYNMLVYNFSLPRDTIYRYIHDACYFDIFVQHVKSKFKQKRGKSENLSKILDKIDTFKNSQEIVKSFREDIKSLKQSVIDYDFCTSQRVNMSLTQKQKDLASLSANIQRLEACKPAFDSFCLKQRAQNKKDELSASQSYEIRTIIYNIEEKLESAIKNSKNEIQQFFKQVQANRPKTSFQIQSVLKILVQKRFKYIFTDKRNQDLIEFFKFVKNKYQQLQKQLIACTNSLKQYKKEYDKIRKEQQSLLDNKMQQFERKHKQELNKLINSTTLKINQQIKKQTDPQKINALQKKKIAQIGGIENDFKKEAYKIVTKARQYSNDKIKASLKNLEDVLPDLVKLLKIFKKATIDIYVENDQYPKKLNLLLEGISKAGGKKIINKLAEQLIVGDEDNIGNMLINQSPTFKVQAAKVFEDLTKPHDIKYVIENLRKLDNNKILSQQLKKIKDHYDVYIKEYEYHKKKYASLPTETTKFDLIRLIKDEGFTLKKQFYENIERTGPDKPILLARIFALWAILKSDCCQEDGQVSFMMNPHPAQITTLFLLLGLNKGFRSQEIIENRLAQVGTGEGKSIVLAGLSCYLALVGFDVRCACYSKYLSQRDQEQFSELFRLLDIEKQIKYGTFNQLCEDILNDNQEKPLNVTIKQMILEEPKTLIQKLKKFVGFNIKFDRENNHKKTILIIDEVDVFFDKNFFGASYCPSISLRGKQVSDLLSLIWRYCKGKDINSINIQDIFQSPQYTTLRSKYSNIGSILDNQVYGMVSGALNFKHSYLFQDKKLVYKDNDAISSNINYGYKTVFANFFEFEAGRVSSSNYQNQLVINLCVAEFSYSLLPKYFKNILGVTGTLEVMSQFKKDQLKNQYKVIDQYIIPSVYGAEKRRDQAYEIVPISNSVTYFSKIVQNIQSITDGRPILIFFKTAEDINNFYCSEEFKEYQNLATILTEQHDAFTRNNRIQLASNKNTITIMTSSFGRGTDFKLYDRQIIKNGGLHAIQAYLPLEESEEVQVKGRIARQGRRGSYKALIFQPTLEELSLLPYNQAEFNRLGIHNILFKARMMNDQSSSLIIKKNLFQSNQKHLKVIQTYDKPNITQNDVIKYIAEINVFPVLQKINVRTIIGIDATGSMGDGLATTCSIVNFAFERTSDILKQKKVSGTFEFQFVAYRNYNSDYKKIIESTAFENTPNNVKRFLSKITPEGGWATEAVEVFFQRVNAQQSVDQVILIGDAGFNTPSQTKSKRQHKIYGKSDAYWNSNGFPYTDIEIELRKIIDKKIQVHTYVIGKENNVEQDFKLISDQTHGDSVKFDLHAANASEMLTHFIVERVLFILGNKNGRGLELVQTYQQKYYR